MSTTLEKVRAGLCAAIDQHTPQWVAPPVLQPAALYLELSGEDIRRRAFLIADDEGELCLRPDMTVPALRAAFADEKRARVIAYEGLVFRRQTEAARESEFVQIGAEWLGAAEDARIIACALEGCRAAGVAPNLRLGDLALVNAFVEACGFAPAWEERVKRALKRPHGFDLIKADIAADAPAARGALADALAAAPDAEAALADLLAAAHIVPVGARSVSDIARRLRERGEAQRAPKPVAAQVALLDAVTHIDAPIEKGLAALEKHLGDAAVSGNAALRAAFDAAVARIEALQALAPLPKGARFAPGFGRSLAYYDGFVFELEAPALGARASLGGGGRYDGLVRRLSGDAGLAGAGFALRPARIAAAAK